MNTSPESLRWRQLQDLLDAALKCAPEHRREALALACGDDAALHEEAQALLRHLDALRSIRRRRAPTAHPEIR